MPPWGPIARRNLIRGLRSLGFEGPLSGGRHQFMVRGDIVVTIPNPHGRDIGVDLFAFCVRRESPAPNGSGYRAETRDSPEQDVAGIEVDARLVHALNGPGLGAAIDFALIERQKLAVLS